MKKILFCIYFLAVSCAFAESNQTGLIHIKSAFSVDETASALVAALEEKGMTIFQHVSHSDGAKKSGLELPPTKLVVFGNPKVGTPLMHCERTIAIDLPQKALIWEDEMGQVWYSYNASNYLKNRHQVKNCDVAFKKIEKALAYFANKATQK